MAYTKTVWQTGDIVTAEKLNNAEQGIAQNTSDISELKEDLIALEQHGYPMASIQEAVDYWAEENKYEIVNNYVTPQMFGAVGDGVTDDTIAIRAAMNSGMKVNGLNKTYKITEGFSDIAFEITNASFVIAFSGYVFNGLKEASSKIRNCNFNLNNVGYGLFDKSSTETEIILNNITVNNAIRDPSAADLIDSAACFINGSFVEISDVRVINNKSHGLIFINSSNRDCNISVNGSLFTNNRVTVNSEESGIGLGAYAACPDGNITITNCVAIGNGDSGIAPHGIGNIVISNCISKDNYEHGITLQQCISGVVNGCVIKDNASAGVRVQGDFSLNESEMYAKNCVISDNVISGRVPFNVGCNAEDIMICNNKILNCITPFYTDNDTDRNKNSANVIVKNNEYSFTSITGGIYYKYLFKNLIIADNHVLTDHWNGFGIVRYNNSAFGYVGESFGNIKKYISPSNVLTPDVPAMTNATYSDGTLTPSAADGYVEFSFNDVEVGKPYTVQIDFDECANVYAVLLPKTTSNALVSLPSGEDAFFRNLPSDHNHNFKTFVFHAIFKDASVGKLCVQLRATNTTPITGVKVYAVKGNEIHI